MGLGRYIEFNFNYRTANENERASVRFSRLLSKPEPNKPIRLGFVVPIPDRLNFIQQRPESALKRGRVAARAKPFFCIFPHNPVSATVCGLVKVRYIGLLEAKLGTGTGPIYYFIRE